MRKSLFAAVTLLVSVIPSAAFAQAADPYPYRILPIACAVGYQGGPERVAMTFSSTPVQELVDIQAAVCTQLIAGGRWSGIDSQGLWRSDMRLVAILQPIALPDLGSNIWATPDSQSIQMATTMANELDQTGEYRVAYPNN